MNDEQRIDRRTALQLLGSSAVAPTALAGVTPQAPSLRRESRVGGTLAEEIPSLCDNCFWRCGIIAKVRDGKVLSVEGNPDHPRNQGRLCARGTAGWRQLEDPNRLKYPLLRTGKRGEGKWKRISWERAIDLWASKTTEAIQKHGPGSIGLFSHGLSSRFINDFMHHLGNPNRTAPSFGQCRGPRDVGFQLTFGDGPGSPARHDMARSKMVVLLGSHIGENVQTGQVAELAAALDNGARLVVADPRMSVVASKAHRWLQVRPGTDTALVLAWIHVILSEGLYDRDYVAQHTIGIEELRRAAAPYTPKWAAQVTQLDPKVIVAEAREMARRRPAVMIHCGRFSTWYGNDTQRNRAMAILTALLGAWGRPGGYYLRSKVKLGPRPCPAPHRDLVPSVASGKHAFTHFGVAAQELVAASLGPKRSVRQWVLYAVNPIQSLPDFGRTREAMRAVDFITMVDVAPTEGALWADLILPEATYLERYDDVYAVKDHPRPFVALRQPVVQPPGEAKGPYWIVQQLAHRMGYKDCFAQRDVTGYLDARLAPLGLDCAQLALEGVHLLEPQLPYLTEGSAHRFKTPSGKIELHSRTLAKRGYDAIPRFEPVTQPGPGWYRLVAGRSPYHAFARTQNNATLMAQQDENVLWLSADEAKAKGLGVGSSVYLQNQDGYRTGPVKVMVTPAIRTDVVYTVHGFGGRSPALKRAQGRGISDNVLTTRFSVDAPTGATGLRVNFVKLVTRDGVEIKGSSKRGRKERTPFPSVPQASGPIGPSPKKPAPTRPGSTPRKDPPPPTPRPTAPAKKQDNTFEVKMEDSC